MTRGILYGIGVGPGDPDFITLKAVKILSEVDMVFAASAANSVMHIDQVPARVAGIYRELSA